MKRIGIYGKSISDKNLPFLEKLVSSIKNKVNADILDKSLSSNVVNINDTKKLVKEMAQSAPIDVDKVAKIKEAISSGKYPLDLDKLSDALMQAYREMKS